MKNNKKGFTLIELLVVIAIIGLLSTLAVVSLNSARAKARDAKRLSDLKQISTAIEMAAANVPSGGYDAITDFLAATATCDSNGDGALIGELTTDCNTVGGTSIANIQDPSESTTPCDNSAARACGYAFSLNPTATNYEICVWLEEGYNGDPAGDYKISAGGIITQNCTN